MKEKIDLFLKKYRHLGGIYPAVPEGWKDIVIAAIVEMEKHMWVWWLPLFIKGWIHDMSKKYEFFRKIRMKLSKDDYYISQIKDKFAGLRIYGYFNDKCEDIVKRAENLCDKTCEKCGSMNDVKKTNTQWIRNYCVICRNNEDIKEHPYFNMTRDERMDAWKKG